MQHDSSIPTPVAPATRATCQSLAERSGVIAPGTPMSDELFAFAEAVMRRQAEKHGMPWRSSGWAPPI